MTPRDESLSRAPIRLPRKTVRRVAWRGGDGIAVFEGRVWITQDCTSDDTVLDAGQSRVFDCGRELFVQALVDAVLIRFRADDCRC